MVTTERERPHALPHEGSISLIALTDHGTSAATVDDAGGIRLWLALDGTREPVSLGVVSAAKALALAETRDGFALAIVDEAGGAQFVQLDTDGARTGRTSVPPEPGIKELYARLDGFVARTRDERIVWLDAYGKERSSVAPQPGEQMMQLVVRRAHALVAFSDETETAATVRWLTFDTALALGPPIALANHLHGPLSLAPTAQRIAGGSFSNLGMDVIDLDTNKVHHVEDQEQVTASGFTSDASAVAFMSESATWWGDSSGQQGERPGVRNDGVRAVGDGIALSSAFGNLVVMTPAKERYLGYGHLGALAIEPMGAGFAQRSLDGVRFYDRLLKPTLKAPAGEVPLDDTHILRSTTKGMFFVELVSKKEIKLADELVPTTIASYRSGVVTVVDTGEAGHIHRWRIDPTAMTAFRAETLTTGQLTTVIPLDEATSGFVAVAVDTSNSERNFLVWRTSDEKKAKSQSRAYEHDEYIIGADAAGNAYMIKPRTATEPLVLLRYPPKGGKTVIMGPKDATIAAVARDGNDVVFQTLDGDLVLRSVDGVEKWRVKARGTISIAVSTDGRTVFAYGDAGASSFDRQTGALLATACSWDFGLSDTAPDSQVLTSLDACAGQP
ncbi:MAG TPA: hypothetical protein VGM39_02160 [Kofleriaceae bacterium]